MQTPPPELLQSLRNYFDDSSDLYCELDFAGVFLYVSRAWRPILGYDSSEMVGKHYSEFLHPDDIGASRSAYEIEDPPDRGHFKNRYRHKNGKYRILLWTGRYELAQQIRYTHARDVTDETQRAIMLTRVAAIQELYMNQGANSRDLFDNILKVLLQATESDRGFIGEISTNLLSGKRFLGTYAITAGFDTENISALSAKIIETRAISIITDKSTLPKPPSASSSTIESFLGIPLMYLGELIGMFGVANRHGGYDAEFAERMKPLSKVVAAVIGLHHARLRENALRERFSVIVENLPIMLTEFGPDSRITWANRFFREKMALKDSDGPVDVRENTMADDDEAKRAYAFMLSGRTDWEDFNLRSRDGHVFPSTWTNVRLKDGRSIGIGQDLTDRRLAESKMIQSSKMASLGEMSAGVSHEINNPLAIIQGSAFRALQNLTTKKLEPVEHDLNRIIQNCQRIASIVRGLRAFSRSVEQEPFVPTPINHIIDDVMNLAQERFKSHNIKLHIEGDTGYIVDCRPVQLVQVLMNLLNNAFDAVSQPSVTDRSVWITLQKDGADRLHIAVEDSGVGIPAPLQDRILEPFFTTKAIGKGTGLGLSISKGLIDSHSGRLWLDSASNRTRFVIELPLRQDSEL